jgi:hypothetical protein
MTIFYLGDELFLEKNLLKEILELLKWVLVDGMNI